MVMYRTFKILIITSKAVYIFSNEPIVSVKDAHAKILSPIGNSTKISNVDMSETVRLPNIKWTLRLNLSMSLGEIEIMSTKWAEITNKCVTLIIIVIDRTEERYMTTSVP